MSDNALVERGTNDIDIVCDAALRLCDVLPHLHLHVVPTLIYPCGILLRGVVSHLGRLAY